MGHAWTKDTSTKLGLGSSDVQFAERVTTTDTDGSYIYKSGSNLKTTSNTLSDSEPTVLTGCTV